MKMKNRLALAVLSVVLCACSDPKFPISFHVETDSMPGKKFTIAHNGRTYEKAPFASTRDFINYRSVYDPNSMTYGVVLTTAKGIGNRIQGVTAQNLGKHILPIACGIPLEVMMLYNTPISGGKLYIRSGFSPADLKALSKVIPPENKEAESRLLKKADEYKPNIVPAPPKDDKTDSKNRTVLEERRGRL